MEGLCGMSYECMRDEFTEQIEYTRTIEQTDLSMSSSLYLRNRSVDRPSSIIWMQSGHQSHTSHELTLSPSLINWET